MAADFTITATETTLPGGMPTAEVGSGVFALITVLEADGAPNSSSSASVPPAAGVDFPALAPSARTFTQGSQPFSTFQTYSGLENRVLLGANQIGLSLSLGFQNLTEAQYNLIFAHYLAVQGGYLDFNLSPEVLAGVSSSTYLQPASYTYRYASPPSVQWTSPGVGSVSVDLVASVPIP